MSKIKGRVALPGPMRERRRHQVLCTEWSGMEKMMGEMSILRRKPRQAQRIKNASRYIHSFESQHTQHSFEVHGNNGPDKWSSELLYCGASLSQKKIHLVHLDLPAAHGISK
jgi:hypothetical protein